MTFKQNLYITNKLLEQGYRYHKLRKYFSKFYYRNQHLLTNYDTNLKTLLQLSLSKPNFYGDVVYKLRKIMGHGNFSSNLLRLSNATSTEVVTQIS